MSSEINYRSIDYLRLLQYTLIIGLLLYWGRLLFIPLSFSVLIAFTLYPICTWLEHKGVAPILAIVITLSCLTLLIFLVVVIMLSQLRHFLQEWPIVKDKLLIIIENGRLYLSSELDIPLVQQSEWLDRSLSGIIPGLLSAVLGLIYSSAVGMVFLILVPFFVILLLYHRQHFTAALLNIFPGEEKEKTKTILKGTVVTFYSFISGMALVYLLVAILNILALLLLGIPHAVFFGVVVSLLTFIPYIGITIGSLMPITLAWITYDSLWYPLGVVLAFALIQYLEANIFFPLIVSQRLRVNTLFVVMAIIFGGIIWGAAGMILFVPFIGIVKLMSEKIDSWRWLSFLLDR